MSLIKVTITPMPIGLEVSARDGFNEFKKTYDNEGEVNACLEGLLGGLLWLTGDEVTLTPDSDPRFQLPKVPC